MLYTLLSLTVEPTPTPTPTGTATVTATPTPAPTVTQTITTMGETIQLDPTQFGAFATIAALAIGLLTLLAVGVYRR